MGKTGEGRRAHNRRQTQAFDRDAYRFEEPIPPDVWSRMTAIVEAAELREGMSVLDVGAGTGALLPLILAKRPHRVEACDLSGEMLRRARRRFRHEVIFHQTDVVDLVGVIEPVDVVFCNACFGNVYDDIETMRAMRELLRPDGRILITHPMGRRFVRELHKRDPAVVRRNLSARLDLRRLIKPLELMLERFTDEPELYIAVLRRNLGA